MSTERSLRRSQTVSPAGVGAVFDILGESLVAADISNWKGKPNLLDAPRIAKMLGVESLRAAPPAPEQGQRGEGVPFLRFPQWLFCPSSSCRRLTRWTKTLEGELTPGNPPRCSYCSKPPQLVPMRFVMICGNGHMSDVDWRYWTHTGKDALEQKTCAKKDQLTFRVMEQRGGGLGSLAVGCLSCKASRTLEGIASPNTPKSLGIKCTGRQPWQYTEQVNNCDADPIIVQRGASNVHFPEVASLLDIPPESDFDQYSSEAVKVRAHGDFKSVLANSQHPLKDSLVDIVALDCGVTRVFVYEVLQDSLGEDSELFAGVDFSPEQILRDEWGAFTTERAHITDHRDRFVVERSDISSWRNSANSATAEVLLVQRLSLVIKAVRLREIRALRGFRRYTMDSLVPADLSGQVDWLPAVEVYGEGIFLSFDENLLSQWEMRSDVQERVKSLSDRRKNSVYSKFLPEASPRFVLLHTFAHILVRELMYSAGYSSSSLRERLYVETNKGGVSPLAGILIYTGAGDSEGTLGGLVRAGDPQSFIPTAIDALRRAEWCSLDPVCRESGAQGPDGLSKAACHACALVAETSCDYSNALLDRMLVIDESFGFFGEVISAAHKQLEEESL